MQFHNWFYYSRNKKSVYLECKDHFHRPETYTWLYVFHGELITYFMCVSSNEQLERVVWLYFCQKKFETV